MQEEMNDLMRKHDMKSPLTGNNLTDATEFNLMFPISIGPSGVYSCACLVVTLKYFVLHVTIGRRIYLHAFIY